MKLKDFVSNMFEVLNMGDFQGIDISLNGLQVGDYDNEVRKIAFAVDACQASIDEAIKQKANLLFVHHGLFWGKPLSITGSHYSRIKTMLDNNLALFACHLPLDAHLELGNNAQIAKTLNLKDVKPFSDYHGKMIGCKGTLPYGLSCEEIIKKLGKEVNEHNVIIHGGKEKNMTIGIVSGSAAHDVEDAIKENLDCYITGESSHSCYHTCLEDKINMLCLGHYDTETFGVRAVMEFVSRNYNLETTFIDIPTCL